MKLFVRNSLKHHQNHRKIVDNNNLDVANSMKKPVGKIRPVKLVRRNLAFSAGNVIEVKKLNPVDSSPMTVVVNRGMKRSRNSDDDFELDRIHPKKRIRLDLAVDIEESVQVQRKRKRVYSDADLHEMSVMHPRKKVRCDC